MATTESRTGFRLPWNAERSATDSTADGPPEGAPDAPEATAADDPAVTPEVTPDMIPIETIAAVVAPAVETPAPIEPAAPPAGRKPNRFMADLTKAMRAAADAARSGTLEQFRADAKAFAEAIHAGSSSEAAELRRHADDDIAGVREWSKAEIARIREETERRIGERKSGLDREIERHAARIERRIEAVGGRVAAYEAQMDQFFERLMAEEDPTRFASLAESMPEPPTFDDGTDDAEPEPEPARAEGTADAEDTDVATGSTADPRIAAMGLTPDFEAAEAEAAEAARSGEPGDATDDGATLDEDALAARLAGLIPADDTVDQSARAEPAATQVVVVGLVSVASIAGFKRQLGRLTGVSAVGVSSGPDGEFVFHVTHRPGFDVHAAIPALSGFAARVTNAGDGVVHVTAQDPESGA
jgi:hypothetical protein